MSSSLPLIGFDRYVGLDWCRTAFDVVLGETNEAQLRELVAGALPGKESQRKTLDILKRFSTKPFPDLIDFIGRGVQIYGSGGQEQALPVAWGCAISSYPFFGTTALTTGRLLSLQSDCSNQEIQRRMAEAYGDRDGIERAVARVLQSQSNWGAFERDESEKRVQKKSPISIDEDKLASWLVEAAVRFAGKSLSLTSLSSLPVLFPFKLNLSLAYVISTSSNLELRSEGPGSQFVSLRESV